MSSQKNILHQIAKASEAIRRKHRMIKMGKETIEHTLSDTFKPVVTPLEKIVDGLENVTKLKSIKNEVKNEDFEQDDFQGKEEKDNVVDEASFKSAMDSDSFEDMEDLDFDKSNAPTHSSPSSWDDIAEDYLIMLGERSKYLDNTYGVRKLSKDRIMIGDSPISFDKNHIEVANVIYPKTKGLLELLFKKEPNNKLIDNDDLKNYEKIITSTNAYRKNYKVDGAVRESKSLKYKQFIEKLIPISLTQNERQKRKKPSSGDGLISKLMINNENNSLDYVYWDDPNELVDRLRLLLSSQAAGNPSHTNEIISIIEELREAKIIYN